MFGSTSDASFAFFAFSSASLAFCSASCFAFSAAFAFASLTAFSTAALSFASSIAFSAAVFSSGVRFKSFISSFAFVFASFRFSEFCASASATASFTASLVVALSTSPLYVSFSSLLRFGSLPIFSFAVSFADFRSLTAFIAVSSSVTFSSNWLCFVALPINASASVTLAANAFAGSDLLSFLRTFFAASILSCSGCLFNAGGCCSSEYVTLIVVSAVILKLYLPSGPAVNVSD